MNKKQVKNPIIN